MRPVPIVCVLSILLRLTLCPEPSEAQGIDSTSSMVLIEGGTFAMGDPHRVQDDAWPVHQVDVSSFYLAPLEVTVGEFRVFVESTGYRTSAELTGEAFDFDGRKFTKTKGAAWNRMTLPQGERHPVVQVSWNDAVAYCNWRSRQEGLQPCYTDSGHRVICDFDADGYRLPTEAEWEFAATARGRDRRFSWGSSQPQDCEKKPANLKDQSSQEFFGKTIEWGECWDKYTDGFPFTAPVGSFAASDLGLYDMTGNVYEWCWDWYSESYYERHPARNPVGPDSGTERTCRGNGWNCPPGVTYNQHRGNGAPSAYWPNVGFRLARTRVN